MLGVVFPLYHILCNTCWALELYFISCISCSLSTLKIPFHHFFLTSLVTLESKLLVCDSFLGNLSFFSDRF